MKFFQGIRTSIAKKNYNFVIFQGGPNPMPPSGSAHADEMPLYTYQLLTSSFYLRKCSGRVLDSIPRGRGFELHQRHCVVSLSKTHET